MGSSIEARPPAARQSSPDNIARRVPNEGIILSNFALLSSLLPRLCSISLAVVCLAFAGCGGDGAGDSDQPDADAGTDVGGADGFGSEFVPSVTSIDLASTTGCRVDLDCAEGRYCFQGVCAVECNDQLACPGDEICSERGRCVTTSGQKDVAGDPTTDSLTPEIEIVQIIQSSITIATPADGAAAPDVVFEIMLNQSLGDRDATYLLQRSDTVEGADIVRRIQGGDDTTVSISIPVGAANPNGPAPERVALELITSFGSVSLDMIPERQLVGMYSGTAYLPAINARLPIEMAVLSDGADGYLLAMPVGPEQTFAPHEQFNDDTWSVRAMRPSGDGWRATFDNEFVLPDDSIFAPVMEATGSGQIGRALITEFTFEEGRIVGEISDRWVGLSETFNATGDPIPNDALLEGVLDLDRSGDIGSYEGPTVAGVDAPASPRDLPRPDLAACSLVRTDVSDLCSFLYGISAIGDFADAEPADAAGCALAVADAALRPVDGPPNTGQRIAAFLSGEGETGDQSFEDFMGACARGEDGLCEPSDLTLCARQLSATVLRDVGDDPALLSQLASTYHETTREALLGQQLAAFYNDDATRLSWLQNADLPPVAQLANTVEDLLNAWQQDVLAVHFEVVAGYLDMTGISVLGFSPDDDAAQALRRDLLMDITQGWRGAMESLTTATVRWNDLFQDDASRADRAAWVASRTRDLYLTAALLSPMNREADAGYLNAGFGGGFSTQARAARQLALPFNQLVYARDAEVAVATSVNPLEDNDSLLSGLQESAATSIEDAATAVTSVLELVQAEALSETELRNRMNNEITDLRAELVTICGLPSGCNESDLDDPQCDIAAIAGVCGFNHARGTEACADGGAGAAFTYPGSTAGEPVSICGFDASQAAISDAGQALIALLRSAESRSQAYADVRAAERMHDLRLAEGDAMADALEGLGAERDNVAVAFQFAVDEANRTGSEELQNISSNYLAQRDSYNGFISAGLTDAARWASWREGDITGDMHSVRSITAFERLADTAASAREFAYDMTNASAEALPGAVGTSTDPSGPLRFAIYLGGAGAQLGMRAVEQGLRGIADTTANALEERRARNEARITADMDVHALDADILARDLLAFETQLELQSSVTGGDFDFALLLSEQARAEADIAAQYEVARAALASQQIRVRDGLFEIASLNTEAIRSELDVSQRINEYLLLVQRASLLDAKYDQLAAQRSDVLAIVGSPASFFGRANRLLQAENRLERAKSSLMDWLVALEYYAVRPFIDERVQILLARNHYQLEEISANMAALQESCGGAINRSIAVVSLRDDLLGMRLSVIDQTTNEAVSSAGRLRDLMAAAAIPLDKRVRYTSNSSIGDLLRRPDEILAAVFQLTLNDFANLGATCNAKIVGIRMQLVGEFGPGRPTVTLLYDGVSQLRSCQPGIDDYVAAVAPGVTSFGSITSVTAPGQGASPVAGVNEFPEGDFNRTLAGLPLASQYTLLVDTQLGENGVFDWDRLEDVLLEVEYAYQDPFPEGRCGN
ncbi:MAG: hypothetical protein ACI81R_001659 [Bradymonadia bacterium]